MAAPWLIVALLAGAPQLTERLAAVGVALGDALEGDHAAPASPAAPSPGAPPATKGAVTLAFAGDIAQVGSNHSFSRTHR